MCYENNILKVNPIGLATSKKVHMFIYKVWTRITIFMRGKAVHYFYSTLKQSFSFLSQVIAPTVITVNGVSAAQVPSNLQHNLVKGGQLVIYRN